MAADLVTRCRPLLGTFVEITAPEGHGEAVGAAFAAIAHVHARMSFHEATSDLAALRRAAPGEVVALDADTVAVLRVARALYEASHGLFDVAVGRQLVSAGFLPKEGLGPLRRYDGTTGDIVILDDSHVRLTRRVLVDLGGIAKGFAVDRAIAALIAGKAPCGLVNAGGDLRGFGPADWTIGLRDADNMVRSHVTIRDRALASSANLLNRRTARGKQSSPHIGRKRQAVLAEGRTTVLAESCAIADAMTKVAMVDPDLAQAILAGHGGQVVRDGTLLEIA